MTKPILYSFRRCPYAIRARLALAVSAMDHELREVSLAAKPSAMLAASSKGTVPVLVQPDGTVIDESLDIMRWALSGRDPEGWLERDDPALIAINDGPFKRELDLYKYSDRYGVDAVVHRGSAAEFLARLEDRLVRSVNLCGPKMGIADAAIFPFVRQFAAVDREWFETQTLPHLKAWLSEHLASDLFKSVMLRVPVWEAAQANPASV